MAKVILDNLANLQNEQTAVSRINTNNDRLEVAMENTLSRDGTSPNEMNSDLDMNNHRIYNLPEPVSNTEPLRKVDADEILALADDFEEVLEATEGVLDAYESLQALYLGAKTSFPTTDNLGNPLQDGVMISLVDQPDPQDDGLYVWHEGVWALAGTTLEVFEKTQYVLTTAGQTAVTVPEGYTPGLVKIYRNGALLRVGTTVGINPGDADVIASNGTSLTFPADVLDANDTLTIVTSENYTSTTPDEITGKNLIQVDILSTSGTWQRPLGATAAEVFVWGGGGSGASAALAASNQGSAGSGGGAGGYSYEFLTSLPNATEDYVIGAGGAAPAVGANNGNSGATSSFGTTPYLSATGGGGGVTTISTAANFNTGGAGGSGSNGQVNLTGTSGSLFVIAFAATGLRWSGRGGSAPSGGSGGQEVIVGGTNGTSAGNPGSVPGGGGSGALTYNGGAAAAGGAGADGLIIVKSYG